MSVLGDRLLLFQVVVVLDDPFWETGCAGLKERGRHCSDPKARHVIVLSELERKRKKRASWMVYNAQWLVEK
jgi:hypothetical protein